MATKVHIINSNQADYTDSEFSFLQAQLFSEGVFDLENNNDDLLVEENTPQDLSVDVKPGGALIEYLKNSITWKVVAQSNATENVAITANTSGSDRVDAIVVHLNQDEPNELKNNVATIEVVDGSGPTALTDNDIDTALGDTNWYRLADVTVPDSATQILNANIADTRTPVNIGLNKASGYISNYLGNGANMLGVLNSPVNEDILPDTPSTYDIGAVGNTFAEGHFDFLFGNGQNITGLQPNTVIYTAGETINGVPEPQAVYVDPVTSEIFVAEPTDFLTGKYAVVGFAIEDGNASDPVKVVPQGTVDIAAKTLTSAIAQHTFGEQTSSGSETTGTFNLAGHATLQVACGFLASGKAGDLKQVNLTFRGSVGNSCDFTVDIFAYDHTTGEPTGASLGTSNTVNKSSSGITVENFVFATAVDITPNEAYCWVLSAANYVGASTIALRGSTTSTASQQFTYQFAGMYRDTEGNGPCQNSTDSGATWSSTLATVPFFELETTTEQYIIGAPLFLDTAGATTLDGDVFVGKLVKDDVMKVYDESRLITKDTLRFIINATSGSGSTQRIAVPANTRQMKIDVEVVGGSTTPGSAILDIDGLQSKTDGDFIYT